MSNIPSDRKYTESHEWLRDNEDGTYTIGITDHAQSQLGDLVFVEVPQVGDTMAAGEECGVVESVKAASDIYQPVSGEVVAVNEDLNEAPELVNQDPYGNGWIFQVKLSDEQEVENLLDHGKYEALIGDE